jgi:hypothetical protein
MITKFSDIIWRQTKKRCKLKWESGKFWLTYHYLWLIHPIRLERMRCVILMCWRVVANVWASWIWWIWINDHKDRAFIQFFWDESSLCINCSDYFFSGEWERENDMCVIWMDYDFIWLYKETMIILCKYYFSLFLLLSSLLLCTL